MRPPPALPTLILATRNPHKVAELQALLAGVAACRSLSEWLQAPTVVEDADTFAGNATKKAVALAVWLAGIESGTDVLLARRTWVLADDSGLEVDALNGAPGVQSARFAALDGDPGNSPDTANNAKLLRLLADVPEGRRTARFRCVLALAPVSPEAGSRVTLFAGACEGRLGFAPSGEGGFGYDPLFKPLGYDETFAELGEEVKNAISHRAQALARLRAWLSEHGVSAQLRAGPRDHGVSTTS